jgi:2-polyprenyl-3-methyl-5-hydroxy-6-metoxy-1,4-benzoquinol methylase
MLTYKSSDWKTEHPTIQGMADRPTVTILDFGCGLAHYSCPLVHTFKTQVGKVHLVLADIPTIRKSFLLWAGEKAGIPITFLDCTVGTPIPDLPTCDVCIATEIFEHLHNPTLYSRRIHEVLLPGGFIYTNISDHKPEFMHVTPKSHGLAGRN